jgi:mono/diheme cytochrome c family protein
MPRSATRAIFFCFVLLLFPHARAQSPATNAAPSSSADGANRPLTLQRTRQSASDLEVGGELAGLPTGATRFLTRDDLLALPQVTFHVSGDTNFADGTQISGVRLEDLAKRIAAAPASAMAVAICDDKYRANYPRDYLAAHHPVLVLTVNGQPPAGWPKDSQEHKYDMGPFLMSHSQFVPAFKILSHSDEPQIPWGVLRLEFRNEKGVFAAIAPRGPHAQDTAVQAGMRIARQNCFRCHNSGEEGGQKSGVSWKNLAALALAAPEDFGAYVRNPVSKNAQAQMPGNPSYDEATIGALVAYFQTFHSTAKP